MKCNLFCARQPSSRSIHFAPRAMKSCLNKFLMRCEFSHSKISCLRFPGKKKTRVRENYCEKRVREKIHREMNWKIFSNWKLDLFSLIDACSLVIRDLITFRGKNKIEIKTGRKFHSLFTCKGNLMLRQLIKNVIIARYFKFQVHFISSSAQSRTLSRAILISLLPSEVK